MQNFHKKFLAVIVMLMLLITAIVPAFADEASSPEPVSLAKCKVTCSKNSGVWDGTRHDIADGISVTLNGVTLKKGTDYVVYNTQTSGSDAKSYSVQVLIVGIGNYCDYASKTLKYKITKADTTLSIASSTYTVYADQLKSSGRTFDPGFTCNVEGATIVGSKFKVVGSHVLIPKGTKAGTYNVTFYAKGDANHNNSSKQSFTVKVEKRGQTITDPTPASYTISAAELKTASKTFTISGVSAQGTLVWKSSNSKVKVSSKGVVTLKKGLAAGTYAISVYAKATTYADQSTTKTITITVTD